MKIAARKAAGRRHGSHGRTGKYLRKRKDSCFWSAEGFWNREAEEYLKKEAELLIERINILIQREQTEMRDRIKVSMYLCATAGIFLVLILV